MPRFEASEGGAHGVVRARLVEAAVTIGHSVDLDQVLARIAAAAREIVPVAHATVTVGAPDGPEFRAVDPPTARDGPDSDGAHLRVPLCDLAETPIGALDVAGPVGHGGFTAEDREALVLLARLSAAPVDNARRAGAVGRVEAQLRRAQRMEAIGILAGGVAHDFNNLLTVILGHTDFVRASLDDGDPRDEDLEAIRTAATRAAELTANLLAFGRQQVLRPTRLSVNDLLRGLDHVFRDRVADDIRVETSLAPGLWAIEADPDQLERVFTCLVDNAAEAMPGGGIVSIVTANVEHDEGSGAGNGLPSGSFVVASVSDTGAGLDPATRERAFDPFFTTKAGEGRGLGLATAFGICKQSGGQLSLQSEPGRGTTARVCLPAVSASGP
jgi:signal transduction histidine kinase